MKTEKIKLLTSLNRGEYSPNGEKLIHKIGDVVEVPKDEAENLVLIGAATYTKKSMMKDAKKKIEEKKDQETPRIKDGGKDPGGQDPGTG